MLARLVSIHGAPAFMRSDNGPEFVSNAILKWIVAEGIGSALSDPGKPWQNGTDESFNGKFRDECLSMEYFRSRPEAIATIETWRKHYNDVRPHSSLDYRTPNEFKVLVHGRVRAREHPHEAVLLVPAILADHRSVRLLFVAQVSVSVVLVRLRRARGRDRVALRRDVV